MIVTRVALPMGDDDSRKILGDRRGHAVSLTRAGQAVLQRGIDSSDADTVQVTHEKSDGVEATVLAAARIATKRMKVAPTPKIIDFGSGTYPDKNVVAMYSKGVTSTGLSIPLSVHYGLDPAQEVTLNNDPDGNLLVVSGTGLDSPNSSGAVRVLGPVLATALRSHIAFDLIDFTTPGSVVHRNLESIRTNVKTANDQRFCRGGMLDMVIGELEQALELRRSGQQQVLPRLLILVHLQGAQSLKAASGHDLSDRFQQLLGDCAAYGVHIVATAESRTSVERVVGYSMNSFGAKAIGRVSTEDSMALTGQYLASKLGQRELLIISASGTSRRTVPFSLFPDRSWKKLAP